MDDKFELFCIDIVNTITFLLESFLDRRTRSLKEL